MAGVTQKYNHFYVVSTKNRVGGALCILDPFPFLSAAASILIPVLLYTLAHIAAAAAAAALSFSHGRKEGGGRTYRADTNAIISCEVIQNNTELCDIFSK